MAQDSVSGRYALFKVDKFSVLVCCINREAALWIRRGGGWAGKFDNFLLFIVRYCPCCEVYPTWNYCHLSVFLGVLEEAAESNNSTEISRENWSLNGRCFIAVFNFITYLLGGGWPLNNLESEEWKMTPWSCFYGFSHRQFPEYGFIRTASYGCHYSSFMGHKWNEFTISFRSKWQTCTVNLN